jgi:hypothetical protein
MKIDVRAIVSEIDTGIFNYLLGTSEEGLVSESGNAAVHIIRNSRKYKVPLSVSAIHEQEQEQDDQSSARRCVPNRRSFGAKMGEQGWK